MATFILMVFPHWLCFVFFLFPCSTKKFTTDSISVLTENNMKAQKWHMVVSVLWWVSSMELGLFFVHSTQKNHQIALLWFLLILLWWFPHLFFCCMKPSCFLHCPFTLYFHIYLWLCVLTDLWWIFQYCRTCLPILNMYRSFGVLLHKSQKLDLWVCIRSVLRRVGALNFIFGSLQVCFFR